MSHKTGKELVKAFKELESDVFSCENYEPAQPVAELGRDHGVVDIVLDTRKGEFAHMGDAENVVSAMREVLEEVGLPVIYVADERHEEEPEKWSNRPVLQLSLEQNKENIEKLLKARELYAERNPILSKQNKVTI